MIPTSLRTCDSWDYSLTYSEPHNEKGVYCHGSHKFRGAVVSFCVGYSVGYKMRSTRLAQVASRSPVAEGHSLVLHSYC